MPSPIQTKRSRTLYWWLAAYILASMTFFCAGVAQFLDAYFNPTHHAHAPFEFDTESLAITSVRPEAKAVGLAKGDIITSLDGAQYSGQAQWLRIIRSSHPGDDLSVGVRKPDGHTAKFFIRLNDTTKPGRTRQMFLVGVGWVFECAGPATGKRELAGRARLLSAGWHLMHG